MASLIFSSSPACPWLLQAFGVLAGWLTYALSPTYRRRLRSNLEQALGPDEAARLWKQAVGEIGKQALELPWMLLRPRPTWSPGRPGERLGARRGRRGRGRRHPVHHAAPGLLRDHRPVFLHPQAHHGALPGAQEGRAAALINAGRSRGNMHIAPADVGGVRRLIKALRAREAVGMLPDQVPGSGEGAWLPFFGRPAYTMTLAARLSEVAGVTTLFAWAERLPGGAGFHLHLRPALTPSRRHRSPRRRDQPRDGSPDPRKPGPVPVGLQPLQAPVGAPAAPPAAPRPNPPGHPMSRIVVALLWLLHWLPLSLQAPIGRAIGLLLYVIIAPRRRVVHTNLRLCFPSSRGRAAGPRPGALRAGRAQPRRARPGLVRPGRAHPAPRPHRGRRPAGNWWRRASR
jgi:KDO2-lipid IV(A) lauroyltransferase